jgi:hypothetical protein
LNRSPDSSQAGIGGYWRPKGNYWYLLTMISRLHQDGFMVVAEKLRIRPARFLSALLISYRGFVRNGSFVERSEFSVFISG